MSDIEYVAPTEADLKRRARINDSLAAALMGEQLQDILASLSDAFVMAICLGIEEEHQDKYIDMLADELKANVRSSRDGYREKAKTGMVNYRGQA